MSNITIALAGNPNSGKSTLFNSLTGSNQYVGNWPGVTVEKKEGIYKKNKDIKFTDLPGVYSLSPYTLEEVVSRDYLLDEKPDVIIDIVDASNIERNLYLVTQLSEIGIPMVIGLNKMDIVRKNKDKIDVKKLGEELGCRIVEISALKNEGLDELVNEAIKAADKTKDVRHIKSFDKDVEKVISDIENNVESLKDSIYKRWYAIKIFEGDDKAINKIKITPEEKAIIDNIIEKAEDDFDDDGEGIITDARYTYITEIVKKTVKKGRVGETTSDKIDRIVTNRILALPIFAIVMFLVYYIAIKVVNDNITDLIADDLFVGVIGTKVDALLTGAGVTPWLVSLIVNGIIGGVGAVLGFLPMIITIFILLGILEDIGYMSRIAFILDRVFRRFGLSGKSFIPILIGTGCSVPGIMATRTIESENDRRMTIVVASFMPCGAKTEIIALFAGSVFTGMWWFGPLCYFIGIAAVIVSGVILKKTSMFSGEPAPFVMELPEYHAPSGRNIFRATWDRTKSFLIKAGTVILLATVIIWFLQNISVRGEFFEFESDSLLSGIGKVFAPIFQPVGFGNWIATVASILGLVAKELVVGTMGVLSGIGEVSFEDPSALALASHLFTPVSAMSFMVFNQLNIPCFAAVGAIKQEMKSKKWTAFALLYQFIFAYSISFMIYQFGIVLLEGAKFNIGTGAAIVVLLIYIYLLFRPEKEPKEMEMAVDK